MRSSRIRAAAGAAAVLVLVPLAACSREKPARASTGSTQPEKVIPITAAPVVAEDVQRSVEMVGTLLAQDEVTVSNENPATVARIMADLGDRVRKGDLLLLLDQREARLELERDEASLVAARKALDRALAVVEWNRANIDRARSVQEDARINARRYQELYAEGAVSASQRDSAQTAADVAAASLRAAEVELERDREAARNAEANVEQTKAAVDLVRKRLADTEVRAPIAGAVKKRLVALGESFKEKTPLFILVSTDPLKMAGTVPERFAPEIRAGQTVQVRVEAFPERTFPGRVTRVSPAVDAETRSLALEAEVPNREGLLRPGFFAKAAILTRLDAGVPFAPEEAIFYFVGITKVFVVRDGTVEERQTRTGLRRDGKVELVDGVRPGALVATSSLNLLSSGVKVSVAKSAGAAQ